MVERRCGFCLRRRRCLPAIAIYANRRRGPSFEAFRRSAPSQDSHLLVGKPRENSFPSSRIRRPKRAAHLEMMRVFCIEPPDQQGWRLVQGLKKRFGAPGTEAWIIWSEFEWDHSSAADQP